MTSKRSDRKPRTPISNDMFDDDESGDFEPTPKSKDQGSGKSVKNVKKTRNLKPRTAPQDVESRGAGSAEVISDKKPGRPSAVLDRVNKRPVVCLDKREKLTKKQQSKLEEWRGKNRGVMLDAFMRGQVEEARRKHGDSAVLIGSDLDNLVVGIPCPAPAFEYLIAQDCFPLGLVFQLDGEQMSNKSALLAEIYRWFRLAMGGGVHQEVETKLSGDLYQSIINWASNEMGLIVNRCTSVEDWQEKLMYWIKELKKKLIGTKEEPGPGRTVPICFGVDSIVGKASEETQERVMESGRGGRAHPVEALSITQYMKTLPQLLDGWPFSLVLVNQLKLSKDDKGKEERRLAGGRGVGFQQSFEIECRVIKRKISCADWEGNVMSLRCMKNSFGPTYRQIQTRMLWWYEADPNTGVLRQRTVFDWDWATVKLLSTLEGREKAALSDFGIHIDTPKTSDVEHTAWSKNFGMKKDDAVPWHELGAMIRQDEGFMTKMRQALGIKRRPLLAGDYLEQMEREREKLP